MNCHLHKSTLLVVTLFMIYISTSNGCIQEEKNGLLGLKQLLESNGADSSKHLPDWVDNSNKDCCDWERVTCHPTTGKVTELFLWNLKDIHSKYEEDGMTNNVWSINCSLFLPFSDLKSLNLSFNSFARWDKNHGFEKLSALKKLEIIDLNANKFEDNTIYHSLGTITSLKTLILSQNGFSDSFPAHELVGLDNLEILDLSYCGYREWLPKQGFEKLTVFKKLETLNLCYNAFTVEVLPYLNSITSLKVLNLGGNRFGRSFPAQGFESLGKFKNLTSLDVSNNGFNRTLFQSLSPLTSLKNLFLAYNNIGDPFPATELTVFGNLEMLDLSFNNLGSLTVKDCELLSKLKKMRHIDLTDNSFEKSVLRILDAIPSLRFLSLESNYMEGPISNQDLTCNRSSLEVLLLNDNKLNGSLPVKGLASLRFLEVLNLANNFFSGGIPSSIGAFSSLKVLSLASNQLNGSLPNQDCELLSKLKKMRHIDLSGNVFEKSVLRILDAIPSLRFLSLERNYMEGPISNQDLTYNRSSLEVLLLNHNKLNGSLPVKGLASLRFLEVLDLKNNFFSGGIPSSIGAFSSLKVLSLASNQLNGFLPDQGLCELTELEELDLINNLLQGTLPPCLSNLKSLRVFNIALNRFTGNLSSSLVRSLISLEFIDLSHNLFEGTFSFSSLANHSNLVVFGIISDNSKLEVETEDTDWLPMFQLKVLVLSNCNLNKLSGNKLPKFLLHQNKLREVDLSENNLDDLFPNWLLVNNTGLDVFRVGNNSLFGAFHLLSVHYTQYLDFSDNNLNGKVQANIGNMLPSISYLNLSKNAFEGDIPSSFGVMRNLETLDLSSNTFSGEAPMQSFGNCTMLSLLLLSNNSLHGQIFTADFNLTSVQILQLADNQFTGPLATSVLSSDLMYLDVSNNYLSGLGDSSKFTALATVILRNNSFVGEFPCSLVPTEFMDVSYNSFSGPISCANQNLNILKHLHLQGNSFTGLIPQSFLNSSVLLTLDVSDNRFSGTIPMFLTPHPELRILLSRGNLLNGSIPSHLCRLNKINLMDLSNNFFTGSIPRCLSNITFGLIAGYDLDFTEYPLSTIDSDLGLYDYQRILPYRFENHVESITYSKREEVNFVTKSRSYSYQGNILNYMSGMDLSGNKLTGEIPTEIGDLSSIRALNLSHNHLTGPIPKSLANLKQVESLDLSYNVLSGNIPMELTDLNSLAVFSVAHNNLSGTIPYGKSQFSTFDVSSYEGNPGLCGSPLEKSCNIVDTLETPTDGSDESDEDWLVYYAIFGGAFFTSLVGTLIVFCLNPNWRKWLFDPVDRVLDSCYLRFVNSRKKQGR